MTKRNYKRWAIVFISAVVLLLIFNSIAGRHQIEAEIDGLPVICETSYLEPYIYICAPNEMALFNLGGHNQ